jgi:hypothetical protein
VPAAVAALVVDPVKLELLLLDLPSVLDIDTLDSLLTVV